MLPFTHQQFVFVFTLYNAAIWPLQPGVLAAGLVMLVLLLRPSRGRIEAILVVLAAMWLWTGLVYQIGFFSRINPVALAFGAMFAAQGVLLLEAGLRGTLALGSSTGLRRASGWMLLIYSLVVYPAVGVALGADYFDLPAFGLTPCPVTLTTIGVLLLASAPPRRLYVVPLLWSIVGGSAAALLRMPQDWVLLLVPFVLAFLAAHDHFSASDSALAKRPRARAMRQ